MKRNPRFAPKPNNPMVETIASPTPVGKTPDLWVGGGSPSRAGVSISNGGGSGGAKDDLPGGESSFAFSLSNEVVTFALIGITVLWAGGFRWLTVK